VGCFTGSAAWAECAAALQRFVASPFAARAPFANAFIALAALAHAHAGAAGEARALIAALTIAIERMGVGDHGVGGSLWFATAAAWELRDEALAASLIGLAERQIAAAGPPGPSGSTQHALARLQLLTGADPEAAFAAARRELEQRSALGTLALLEHDVATIAAAGSVARPPARPDGLTARELQILGMLAAGMTNGEIAAAAVLAPATVQRHVANIYAKAGLRNRAEATAYALGHGIGAG
jgi:DNA-binding CsgD family transcriptional regulator